jgi:HJR/Mrr/RecB family endonuclease
VDLFSKLKTSVNILQHFFKLVNWVLVKFKEIKFCLNQSFKILNTMLILLLKSVGFEWDNKMLGSSANKIGTDLSFTNLSVTYKYMEKQRSQN